MENRSKAKREHAEISITFTACWNGSERIRKKSFMLMLQCTGMLRLDTSSWLSFGSMWSFVYVMWSLIMNQTWCIRKTTNRLTRRTLKKHLTFQGKQIHIYVYRPSNLLLLPWVGYIKLICRNLELLFISVYMALCVLKSCFIKIKCCKNRNRSHEYSSLPNHNAQPKPHSLIVLVIENAKLLLPVVFVLVIGDIKKPCLSLGSKITQKGLFPMALVWGKSLQNSFWSLFL